MVYLTRNPQTGIHETGTRVVLENIKVFAVNDIVNTGNEKDGKTIKAATVSLLVTPEQAARVMLAAQLGTINLAMRSPEEGDQAHGNVSHTPPRFVRHGRGRQGGVTSRS